MSFLIESNNELEGFLKLLEIVDANGFKSNRYKEILNCLLTIHYNEDDFSAFKNFKDIYFQSVGKTAKSAWDRAERVYTTYMDRITKPSYLKRLRSYPEIINNEIVTIDQIENIIYELAEKPKYSLLSFAFFRPADLILKKRPGYVPCPLVGDFKFRKGELHLNVFFRSHDILNFTYPDIYHLRELQIHVLHEAQKNTSKRELKQGKVGSINFHFSRVFLPLRMEMVKGEYINGKEIKNLIEKLKSNLVSVNNLA